MDEDMVVGVLLHVLSEEVLDHGGFVSAPVSGDGDVVAAGGWDDLQFSGYESEWAGDDELVDDPGVGAGEELGSEEAVGFRLAVGLMG